MNQFVYKITRKIKNLFGHYDSPDGILILMYHRINDELPEHNLVTRTKEFDKQLKFIYDHNQNYEVISLKELEDDFKSVLKRKTPKTKVIITFDDGYMDNYENAYPILKKYGFTATIFLTTGLIGTNGSFDRYKHLSKPDMLDWQQVEKMFKDDISFGAHTMTHPHLPELSYDEQLKEIKGSLDHINTFLPTGERLSTFCYPYGEYNKDTLKIMEELNLKYALTVVPGVNDANAPRHELKRVEVSGLDNIKSFEYKVLEKYKNV